MFVVYSENNHDYIQKRVSEFVKVEDAIEFANKLDDKINATYDDTFIWIVEEIDIWNYLKEKRWKNSYNLLLYQMVDDIINVDALVLADYYKKDSV